MSARQLGFGRHWAVCLVFGLALLAVPAAAGCGTTTGGVTQFDQKNDIYSLIVSSDEEAATRAAAHQALAKRGAAVVPELCAYAKQHAGGKNRTALWAVVALGNLGPQARDAIPMLLDTNVAAEFDRQSDRSPFRGQDSFLGERAGTSLLPTVGKQAQTSTHHVKFLAWAWALKPITGNDFGPDEEKWRTWWSKQPTRTLGGANEPNKTGSGR